VAAAGEEASLNSPKTLRVGVFGAGAMGRNHVRLLSSLPGSELVGVYDPKAEAAEAAARDHGARVFSKLEDLAGEIEAAVVAAPTVAHADMGCALLDRGLHVLIEKPLAASLEEADRLIAAAEGKVLAVGHIEFFNPAVQALLSVGTPPRFVEVQRLGVFSPRSLDVDVVLDLMIHDLQILHALDPSPVAEIRATGIAVLSSRIDIANVRVELESGAVANLTASRVSSERARRLRVFLPNQYYSLDYQAQEIKGYRLEGDGDQRRILPDDLAVEKAEPLKRELEAFLAACRGEPAPRVDGLQGRRALETALQVVEAIRRPC
jgi:predicted dehydrogenase